MRRLEAGARLGLAGWAMAITMARAVRYPNDFAEAHWLLDYRFGFIKRGLAGSALTVFTWAGLARPTADTVAALSFAVFGLLAIALLAMTARLLNTAGPHSTSFAAAAVVATSPFVVMTAHFMGYMDHLGLLAAFGAAWLALRGRAWPAGVVSALGALVHESFLLVGLPLVLLAGYLGPARPRGPRPASSRSCCLWQPPPRWESPRRWCSTPRRCGSNWSPA
jgi:ACR3 family arsenite efflux pump ArsB